MSRKGQRIDETSLINVAFGFRIKKTEVIVKMLTDFEQGLETVRSWMDTIETKLQRPFSLNILNANELRSQEQTLLVCIRPMAQSAPD